MEQGTVYMITGGAKGIGAATAEHVVNLGGRVAVCNLDEQARTDMCKKLGDAAIPIALDVRSPEAWKNAIDKIWQAFGRIDVLVNNAGIAIGGTAYELAIETQQKTIEINLLGPMYGINTIVPRFLKQGSGHIVNVGSFAAFSPTPGLASYAASKHGLRAFTHSCDIELIDTPVRVTLVCCSAVETPMLKQLAKDDQAKLVFTEKPMPALKVAEAIVRSAEKKPHEILLPPVKGAFLRFLGLFPGFMKKSMPYAMKQGELARKKRLLNND